MMEALEKVPYSEIQNISKRRLQGDLITVCKYPPLLSSGSHRNKNR